MSRNSPREWALAIAGGLAFAAGLVWVLRPAAPDVAPVASTAPVLPSAAPQMVAPPPARAAAAPADVSLSGLRTGPDGGMAIVVTGGRQYLLRPGRSLPGGLRLVRVEATRAVLAGPSGEMILAFTREAAAPSPPAAAPGGDPTPWLAALSPIRDANGISGWRLGDVSALPPLAKAGLKSGDVLIAVDDNPLISEEKIMELPQEIAANGVIQLRYRRGTQDREVAISP
jgi:pyruvate/2-oxoglutarate dehydrogenase complex dihydrolipoamide acyltransferase (E2) component